MAQEEGRSSTKNGGQLGNKVGGHGEDCIRACRAFGSSLSEM